MSRPSRPEGWEWRELPPPEQSEAKDKRNFDLLVALACCLWLALAALAYWIWL